MEEIISYLAEYFIPKIFELKLEYYKNPTSLAYFAIATKEETNKLGREFLQASIKEMDMLIKNLPARKRKWVVEHKADGRQTGHMKDSKDDAKTEIHDCIRNKKKSDFLEVVKKLKGCTDSEKIQAKIEKAANYISSNWMAAKYRLRKSESVKACSAEGHVYHVLSSRMSTQAMGWSKCGAGKMAHLREYYYNGGNMFELAKFQKEEMPVAAGAEDVVLSASAVLASEKSNRSRNLIEYGKYSERMHSTLSPQNSKQLMFYLNGKI